MGALPLLALTVWRTSVASDAAADETLAGALTALYAEDVRARSTLGLYEDYRAFTGYVHSHTLSDQYAEKRATGGASAAPQQTRP